MSAITGFRIEEVKRQRGRSFAEACSALGRRLAKSRRHWKDYGWTEKVDTFDFAQIEPPARPVTAIVPLPAEGKSGGQPEGPGRPRSNKIVERFDAGLPGPTTAPAAFWPGFPGTEIDDEDEPAIEFWDDDGDPAEARRHDGSIGRRRGSHRLGV
jgi:hypothetical protein